MIKCDEASVHRRDEFVGHDTTSSDFVNPDRQHSNLDGNPKSGCESHDDDDDDGGGGDDDGDDDV